MGKRIKSALTRAGLLAGLGLAAALMALTGAGFLTAAAWYALLPQVGIVFAALIIGLTFLVLGLILVLVITRDRSDHAAPPDAHLTPKAAQTPPLMEAFLFGLQTGSNARTYRRG